MNELQPKIWIGCLASYNTGKLYGAWIDADQSSDIIMEEIQAMLASSPISNAERWAIFEYDDFGSFELGRHESLKQVAEYAEFLVKHGELGVGVFDNVGDFETAKTLMTEGYHGEYQSEVDFAMNWVEETMEISEHLKGYIDYQSIADDIFIDGFFSIRLNGSTHVFANQ